MGLDSLVGRHQGQPFGFGRGDEEAVSGVVMVTRQHRGHFDMPAGDRQHVVTGGLELPRDVGEVDSSLRPAILGDGHSHFVDRR